MILRKYEDFRENGWKSYFNDVSFPDGDSPIAKVISYFQKRVREDDNGGSYPEREVVYDLMVNADWLVYRFNHTMKYKRNWKDSDIYKFAALQMYVNEVVNGGYKKALITRTEFAMIAEKK